MFGEGELGCNDVILRWDGARLYLDSFRTPSPSLKVEQSRGYGIPC
jgi:hypothetical protein